MKGERFTKEPWTYEKWQQESIRLLDLVDRHFTDGYELKWSDINFREEKSFKAGMYQAFNQFWLPAINSLADERTKTTAYTNIRQGVSLFSNIKRIPWQEARPYRNFNLATNSMEHTDNRRLKRMRGDKKDSNIEGVPFPPIVHYPADVQETDGKLTARPALEMNAKNTSKHHKFVTDQILKWRSTGAIEIIEDQENFKPKLSTAITVADNGSKLRLCNDGGQLKHIQTHKIPCHLDPITSALRYMKKGDLMCKNDDKQGFHHLLLDKPSQQIAVQWWGGYFFRFKAAAFGFSIIPGCYQLANMTIVNHLRRRHNIPCWLYLDDRLFVERPKNEEENRRLINGELGPQNTIAATAIQSALGGCMSLTKSELTPTTRIEFLGFVIDTLLETVEIPEEKWIKFVIELAELIATQPNVSAKELERIRGKMCAFLIVVANMRLYIREITRMIMKAETDGLKEIELSKECIEELHIWLSDELSVIKKVRMWPKLERTVAINPIIIWTDASNMALGWKCDELNITETYYYTKEQALWKIHHKEALAILLFIEKFASKLKKTSSGSKKRKIKPYAFD